MKKAHVVEILILIFLFLCISLISFWAYKTFFENKNTHTLYFKDVDGIVVGSPVRFMGVIVGHVSKLKYNGDIITVKIFITKKGINFPMGSKASVQFTGLAGSKSIEISPPKDETDSYVPIITENPVRIKDIFEYTKSYTNALLSVENQIELISADSVYEIVKRASTPYDWSTIDNGLDDITYKAKNLGNKSDSIVNKEKQLTDKINEINRYIKK